MVNDDAARGEDMTQGIDLQGSFIQLLTDLGLPISVAKTLWLPLPMVVILVGATVSIFVTVWLERKISEIGRAHV